MRITAHRTVAHLAEEMAQTVYEQLAQSDEWFAANPDRRRFVQSCAPTLRTEARQILAGMLERNDVSEADKNEIFGALLLDATLPKNGTGYQV